MNDNATFDKINSFIFNIRNNESLYKIVEHGNT